MIQEKISPATRGHEVFRYFLPFQSIGQFFPAIVEIGLYAVGYFLMGKLFVALFGVADQPVEAGIYFGIVMVCFHLYMMLPAHFTIAENACENESILAILDREIRKMGYEDANFDENGGMHCRKKGWKFLYWKEEDFQVEQQGAQIVVSGPLFSIDKLRKLLVKESHKFSSTLAQ